MNAENNPVNEPADFLPARNQEEGRNQEERRKSEERAKEDIPEYTDEANRRRAKMAVGLKTIDASILVISLIGSVNWVFSGGEEDNIKRLLFCLFTVGAYQLISFSLQLPVKDHRSGLLRRIYGQILRYFFFIGVITIPVFIFFLYAALVVTPLMAAYYTILSVAETVELWKIPYVLKTS
ncbi:MAG: hypothetical protein JST39_07465 [Bacteroidetes bacterium]|nr:hypothetical protein [Bacteroidota bacterium]